MDCSSSDPRVSASLGYSCVGAKFALYDVPELLNPRGGLARNIIEVVPFKLGENIDFGARESSIFAFDKNGLQLEELKCWPIGLRFH